MRRVVPGLAAIMAAVVYACAQPGAPPGGPPDVKPPALLRITPDSNAVNVRTNVSTPPLAVPPLSITVTVIVALPL